MKITHAKIERVCELRYNGVKIFPIALNENLSEKAVRTILKENYQTYVRNRERTQLGYSPWGNLPSTGKLFTEMERRYDGGNASQDVHCNVLEHQGLLEKNNEQEKIIDAYKENDRTKELQLQEKDKTIDQYRKENESLKQKNRENEQKQEEHTKALQEINRLHEEVGMCKGMLHEKNEQINDLTQRDSPGIRLIRIDLSNIKTTFDSKMTTVEEAIGSLKKVYEENKTIITERNQFRDDLQQLKNQNYSNIIDNLTGLGAYAVTMWGLVQRNKSSIPPPTNEEKNTNIRSFSTPSQHSGITQPHGQPIIRANVQQNVGTLKPLCSGAFYPNYRGQHHTGLGAISPRQDDVIQTDPNSVTLVTAISGVRDTGVFVSSHFDTIGYTSPVVDSAHIPTGFQVP